MAPIQTKQFTCMVPTYVDNQNEQHTKQIRKVGKNKEKDENNPGFVYLRQCICREYNYDIFTTPGFRISDQKCPFVQFLFLK